MEKSFDYEQYNNSIHRLGRIMNTIGILSLLATPFLFALVLGASLSWSGFAKGLL